MVTLGREAAGLLKGRDVGLVAAGANLGCGAVMGRVVGVVVGRRARAVVGRVVGMVTVGVVVEGLRGAIGLKLVVTMAICILLLQVLLRVRF